MKGKIRRSRIWKNVVKNSDCTLHKGKFEDQGYNNFFCKNGDCFNCTVNRRKFEDQWYDKNVEV